MTSAEIRGRVFKYRNAIMKHHINARVLAQEQDKKRTESSKDKQGQKNYQHTQNSSQKNGRSLLEATEPL